MFILEAADPGGRRNCWKASEGEVIRATSRLEMVAVDMPDIWPNMELPSTDTPAATPTRPQEEEGTGTHSTAILEADSHSQHVDIGGR